MSKLSITTELKSIGEIHKVSRQILATMPEQVLFSKSKEELCYYVLDKFDFPTDTIIEGNIASLEKGCKAIMELMGIDDDFEKKLLLGKDEKFDNQLDRFLHYFFNFTGLPGVFKDELEKKVQCDLDKINIYIAKYEKIDFIKNSEKPRNHAQRTDNDFYLRCIEEKVKIENHLHSGIKERAINKSRREMLWGVAEMMFEEYKDRPYKLIMPKSSEYFEAEMIDKVGHRLGEIPMLKGRELKKLYKEDKEIFYSELQKIISDEKVLGLMLQGIDFLPFIPEQRKEIFKELAELYKNNNWYGFYALALTQIEGLFTEMCRLCEPRFNSPFAALPDKVEIVRPYHIFSENRFDYFQYYLPNLRNRFLHYGLDVNERIEILCKELLFDLEKVVSIFLELNIDALCLLKLIRKRDNADFLTVSGLCYYFKLLGSVKQKKQYKYFETEVKSLNEIFLPEIVDALVWDLETRVIELIEYIYEPIKFQSNLNGFEIDLKTISYKDIVDNNCKIKASLEESFNWQFKSEIEELLQILILIKSYKIYIDISFISVDLQRKIDTINTKYGEILCKIKLIDLQNKK